MFLKKALFTAGLAAAATDSVTFGITLDGHTPLCLKYQPPNEAFDFDDSFLVPLLYEDRSSLSLFANIQMDETEENLSVNQVLFYSPSGHVFDLSLEDPKIPAALRGSEGGSTTATTRRLRRLRRRRGIATIDDDDVAVV